MINFEGSEINVIILPPKKWTNYIGNFMQNDHNHKIFISFERTVSSDRSRFTLLKQKFNSDIWAPNTIHLSSSVLCKVKALALYGLIFTIFMALYSMALCCSVCTWSL